MISIALARSIHGHLVPETTYYGQMTGSDPPLHIYTMPYLRGISSLKALSTKAELDLEEEARHICYIKHLARYFARCWLAPLPVDSNILEERRSGVQRRLAVLRRTSPSILHENAISELERCLPTLFGHGYPQVLTHKDLTKTNILVQEKTLEITDIVDWSLAEVLPFGMELYSLCLMTGYMGIDGWHQYTSCETLRSTFWEEFWLTCGIHDHKRMRRKEVRDMAQLAGRLSAVLHYAFLRNTDGSPSEEVATSKGLSMFLPILLAD